MVAYGLVGNIRTDLTTQPSGKVKIGQPVSKRYLAKSGEIDAVLQKVNTDMFHKEYAAVFDGDESWQAIQIPKK